MRFIILVKATAASEAGDMPGESLLSDMAAWHEKLARAGALLDGAGLLPTDRAVRIGYDGAGRTVVNGPFAGPHGLVAGYTLFQARSWDEALEWARSFPNPSIEGGRAEIELRQLRGLEDFADSGAIRRFERLAVSGARPTGRE